MSPWVLWPPDGLNLKQGTQGQWFGYGYLPLPLTEPKEKTAGESIPTGNQCWTLFLNAGNFKGPVTFFTPYFWSQHAVKDSRLAGQLLDSRPSNPNRALQMETQHIPCALATDSQGVTYARITPTQFPCNDDGTSSLVHRITSYNRQALWDRVEAWFAGGPEASGRVDAAGEVLHSFPGKGGATWKIYADGTQKEEKQAVAWSSFATPFAPNPTTFGYRWSPESTRQVKSEQGDLVVLPEYFRLDRDGNDKQVWSPIAAEDVPTETGLADIRFETAQEPPPKVYETPEDTESSWKQPGPVAGPFTATLGDGSLVTYAWYRFADQPALFHADLTNQEREEMLHRHWTRDREYLTPPESGQLADIDPALIVTPPAGLEVGYVPIVTRQEPAQLEKK